MLVDGLVLDLLIEQEVLNREIYRINWKIREQDGFNPMNNEISVLFLVKEMGNHVMIMALLEMKMQFIVQLIEKDVAILNSLANYTYTHQLLKCKAF